MNKLIQHRDLYKQALRDGESNALLKEKAWLTATVAEALLEQDAEMMRHVRACCADLSSLADRFDVTGKPGDRWRALGDLLSLALESGKPLEQLRLVLPSTVGGSMMGHIQRNPGITQIELADRCDKQQNHISNEIKKLEKAGLILKIKRGKNNELYLSVLGKQVMESIAPVKTIEAQAKSKRAFLHMDKEREKTLTQNGKAELPSLKRAANG